MYYAASAAVSLDGLNELVCRVTCIDIQVFRNCVKVY